MDAFVAKPSLEFEYPKYCVHARNTSFASFYVSKVRKMLRNTPKHHFVSNGVEWLLSLWTYFRKFGTRNSAFRTETQVLHRFTCWRFAKCSETLPNIMLGLVEKNGCFRCETIFGIWVPEILRSRSKHKFPIVLRVEGLQNAPKDSKTSFCV